VFEPAIGSSLGTANLQRPGQRSGLQPNANSGDDLDDPHDAHDHVPAHRVGYESEIPAVDDGPWRSPTPAMDNLVERSPVHRHDGCEGAISGKTDRDDVRAEPVLGVLQNLSGKVLIGD